MNITKGIISKPVKVCVYGVEGIGKTTFASQFPEPLFFDLDKGSAQLDVSRVTDITSWPLLMSNIKEVYDNPTICKTLVIDTADAAERMCIDYICGKFNKKGIEDFGYGAGYTYLTEEFARFLVQLDACIGQGINVVVLAHAVLKTVTLPEEMGTYDHWELKLSSKTTNKVAPLVKEWADLLLFANYKTILIEDGARKKRPVVNESCTLRIQHLRTLRIGFL
ncbi:MAG: ATP-binding protein [Dialister invisus]